MFSNRFPYQCSSNPLIQLLKEKKRSGKADIIDLTETNPTIAGFNYNKRSVLESLVQPSVMDYHPNPQGLASARSAVADYYKQNGVTIDASSLFLTASTSEAYSYLFKLLLNPDEEVLIPRPGYPLFELLAGLENTKAVEYPLSYSNNEWNIDIEGLNNVISTKTKAIVIVSPNNPTGSYLKPEELSALNRVCHDHDCVLIVDEVFFDYANRKRGDTFQSACLNNKTLTFTVNGISKVLALPQLKLSWILINGPQKQCIEAKSRLEFIADTYLSVSVPVQAATEKLFKLRKDIQGQIIRRIEHNEKLLVDLCNGQSKGIVLKREGGWYAVLRLTNDFIDEEVAYRLLEKDNVFIHPGYFYNFQGDNFLVMSLLPVSNVFHIGVRRVVNRVKII